MRICMKSQVRWVLVGRVFQWYIEAFLNTGGMALMCHTPPPRPAPFTTADYRVHTRPLYCESNNWVVGTVLYCDLVDVRSQTTSHDPTVIESLSLDQGVHGVHSARIHILFKHTATVGYCVGWFVRWLIFANIAVLLRYIAVLLRYIAGLLRYIAVLLCYIAVLLRYIAVFYCVISPYYCVISPYFIALYCRTIALYRRTVALYRRTVALYRRTITLYRRTIALYRRILLRYIAVLYCDISPYYCVISPYYCVISPYYCVISPYHQNQASRGFNRRFNRGFNHGL